MGQNPAVQAQRSTLVRAAERIFDWLPLVVCASVGLCIWLIFRPGNYSIDSIIQIRQAMDGKFEDGHPPIMAVVLHYVLRLGGKVEQVVLAQCLLGVLGIYLFVQGVLRWINGPAGSACLRRWQALVVTLLLLCPISPLAVYLTTFWKDVWLLICLPWVGVFAFRVFDPAREKPAIGDLIVLVLIMVLSILARHNALALAPVYGLLAALGFARRAGRWAGVVAFLMPAVLFYAADRGLRRGWNVSHFDFSTFLKVMDMIALCAVDLQIEEESPLFHRFLVPNFRSDYVHGRIALNYQRCLNKPILHEYLDPEDREEICREYRLAIRRHPLDFAWVKLQGFLYLLRDIPDGKFCMGIESNDIGLAYRKSPAPLRERLFQVLWDTSLHPVYRWAFFKHAVWLVVNLLGAVAVFSRRIRQDVRRAVVPLLFLGALAYYATYLAATCGGDFRYMYPASLIVQAITFAGLVGWFGVLVRKLFRFVWPGRGAEGTRCVAGVDVLAGRAA